MGGWATSKMDTSSAVCSFFSKKTVHKRFRPHPPWKGEGPTSKQNRSWSLFFSVYHKEAQPHATLSNIFSMIVILAFCIICVISFRIHFCLNSTKRVHLVYQDIFFNLNVSYPPGWSISRIDAVFRILPIHL